MIGREENQEEVTLKVVDRRKFNPDGSLKDGVVIEPVEAKKEDPKPQQAAPAAEPPPQASADPALQVDATEFEDAYAEGDNLDDVPGVDDPASFVNFLSTLATNAAAALGGGPLQDTGP